MKRSKTSTFDFHTGILPAFARGAFRSSTLLVILALSLAGCQSGAGATGLEDRGDPAFAHTCRQAARQFSGNDPIYPRLNALRKTRGASPLFYDRDLSKAAHAHAAELAHAGRLDHKAGPSERLRGKGLVRRYVAENLARFEHRARPRDYVVRYWTEGQREYTNLISRRYVRVGFALQGSPAHCYAVLILTE